MGEESFETAPSEVQSFVSLGPLAVGNSFTPSTPRRSPSITSLITDPRSEFSSVNAPKKRPSQYSLREHAVKNLRLKGNRRTSVYSESSDERTRDSAGPDQMVDAGEAQNRVTPNDDDDGSEVEAKAIRAARQDDGKNTKFLVGMLTDGTKRAVFVHPKSNRLRHFILEHSTQDNPRRSRKKIIQVRVENDKYEGVFEKYQNDRPALHRKLLENLSVEPTEGESSKSQQGTGDRPATRASSVSMASENSARRTRRSGHPTESRHEGRHLPIRTSRLTQDPEDNEEQLGMCSIPVFECSL